MDSQKKFRFEVHASKDVIVEGFTDAEAARQWLCDNLDRECYDILDSGSYVSDGEET